MLTHFLQFVKSAGLALFSWVDFFLRASGRVIGNALSARKREPNQALFIPVLK